MEITLKWRKRHGCWCGSDKVGDGDISDETHYDIDGEGIIGVCLIGKVPGIVHEVLHEPMGFLLTGPNVLVIE